MVGWALHPVAAVVDSEKTVPSPAAQEIRESRNFLHLASCQSRSGLCPMSPARFLSARASLEVAT